MILKVITVRARAAIPPLPLRKEIETITSYTKVDASTIVAIQVRVIQNYNVLGRIFNVTLLVIVLLAMLSTVFFQIMALIFATMSHFT
jgi:uncharacterized membrane protein